jgi:hypothetical protein
VEPATPYKKFFVREPGAYTVSERFHSLNFVEVIEEAGRKFGHGTLLVPQIKVVASSNPVSKNELRFLAIRAFCQAFNVPIPTEKELKQLEKEAKNSTEQEKKAILDHLLGGKEGISAWNQLTAKERTKLSPFKKTDLKGQDL